MKNRRRATTPSARPEMLHRATPASRVERSGGTGRRVKIAAPTAVDRRRDALPLDARLPEKGAQHEKAHKMHQEDENVTNLA